MGRAELDLLKRAFREVAVIGGLVERHHPGQAQDRAAGQLLDRPHLRRAAPLRARPSAAARRLGRCPRADDRARPPGPLVDRAPATMVHVEARPDHADGGAADGHRRPRSDAAGRRADEALLIEAEALAQEAMSAVGSATCNALLLLPLASCPAASSPPSPYRGRCRHPAGQGRSAGVDAATTSQSKPTRSAAANCARPRNAAARRASAKRCRKAAAAGRRLPPLPR